MGSFSGIQKYLKEDDLLAELAESVSLSGSSPPLDGVVGAVICNTLVRLTSTRLEEASSLPMHSHPTESVKELTMARFRHNQLCPYLDHSLRTHR